LDVLVERGQRYWHILRRLPCRHLVWLDFWTVGYKRSVDYMGRVLC